MVDLQCSVCVDNFLGTPTSGHQCYRQVNVEREYCFDPVTQMNCNPTRDPNPLGLYRTVFFGVQPKYLNVDIRIILDVTRGGEFTEFAENISSFNQKLCMKIATLHPIGEQGAVRSIGKSELRTLPSDVEYVLT